MAVTVSRGGGGGQSVRERLENRVSRQEIFVEEVIEAGSEAGAGVEVGRLSVRQCGVLSVVVKADCSREQEAEQITVSCRSDLVQISSVVMKYFYNSVI